jgi:hypothetical protein
MDSKFGEDLQGIDKDSNLADIIPAGLLREE